MTKIIIDLPDWQKLSDYIDWISSMPNYKIDNDDLIELLKLRNGVTIHGVL